MGLYLKHLYHSMVLGPDPVMSPKMVMLPDQLCCQAKKLLLTLGKDRVMSQTFLVNASKSGNFKFQ
ncbi:hypothetical protein GCM10023116_19730 [Kistimonas scapharcae]|uniref:Uncharacterized protein n=1 Tax=Kistimonas scapharcae TaxID=1036133 RepID=A0ABP8V2Q7_9GAMM